MSYLRLKHIIGIVLPRTFVQFSLTHSSSSQQSLQESILVAVEAKNYRKIPELLNSSKPFSQNAKNPFTFLSTFSESHRVHIVDEILQSFIPIRPRFKPVLAYSCLLSYVLESPNPLPLGFAILQRTLRSGCLPGPQTYLIMSLCKVDRITEAVEVLRGMGRAGVIPDLDSYGSLIGEMSDLRMPSMVVGIVKEMVSVHGLNPRQDMVVKAVNGMRAHREIWRAVEMIEYLEKEDVSIGFEAYELVLEGCLECRQFVMAGKFVIRMTEKGFIPYIKVRQRVVEGLVGVGESELSSVVRQRFAELKS